jgi:hydroxyethylthiazole kinase-like uncharacterized protein yjeF
LEKRNNDLSIKTKIRGSLMQPLYKSCYELDSRCYNEYNLTEDILMEHASNGMANYIRKYFQPQSTILIVAGVGNNGADGIVLARQLQDEYKIKLYIPFGVKSPMAKLQLKRVQMLNIEIVNKVEEADIIVDAIFGAGLSRELNETTRKIIVQLEALKGFKIACDVPTGIDIDGNPLPMAFIANITITMGAYKEALYSDMAKDFVGEIICVDLGVSYNKYITGFDTDLYLLEESDIRLPHRDWSKITHKGSFGHLAVIVGEKEGAGILTGSSAFRFGVGLVTLIGDIQTPLPLSLMQDIEIPTKSTAIALGMGFGHNFDEDIVDEVLDNKAHLVLDADIFSSERIVEFLEQENKEIVLTPHPKEFVTLWNMVIDEPISISLLQANRFNKVREFCSLFPNVTLLLKGANMIIAQDNKLFVNPYGTSQLSKGGSGDVLSGLIGGLLAQGWSGINASIHGSLAMTASAKKYKGNSYAMLPTDLINNLEIL